MQLKKFLLFFLLLGTTLHIVRSMNEIDATIIDPLVETLMKSIELKDYNLIVSHIDLLQKCNFGFLHLIAYADSQNQQDVTKSLALYHQLYELGRRNRKREWKGKDYALVFLGLGGMVALPIFAYYSMNVSTFLCRKI